MRQAALARGDDVTAAVVTMVATTAAMAFGDALVKRISAEFGLWQLFVMRSAIALPLLALLMGTCGGGGARVHPGAAGWAALRSLLLVAMWICFYAALTVLDLATVATAYYTGPLFITLLSAWLAGERVGRRRWLAVATGFAGVVLMLRPGGGALAWPVLLAVLSGLSYAMAAVVTRARLANAAPLVLSGFLNVAFLGAGAAATLALSLRPPAPALVAAQPFLLGAWGEVDSRAWWMASLLAVLIVAISTGIARAYQAAPSSIVATFDYCYLPFAALWGFVFFAAVPGLHTVAGMALIGGAGLVVLATRDRPGERR